MLKSDHKVYNIKKPFLKKNFQGREILLINKLSIA